MSYINFRSDYDNLSYELIDSSSVETSVDASRLEGGVRGRVRTEVGVSQGGRFVESHQQRGRPEGTGKKDPHCASPVVVVAGTRHAHRTPVQSGSPTSKPTNFNSDGVTTVSGTRGTREMRHSRSSSQFDS